MVNCAHHVLVTLAILVRQVGEDTLVVIDDKVSGRQSIKWVALLLLFRLGGSSGSGLLGRLLGLLLGLENGLDTLFGELDLAEDGDELGEGGNATKPSAGLRGSLGEALVQDELERQRHGASEEDIGEGALGADEPVTGEGLVDRAKVRLDALDGLVEHGLGHVGVLAEDGVDSAASLLLDTALKPVHPLVDLGALDGV